MQQSTPTPMISMAQRRGRSVTTLMRELRGLLAKELDPSYKLDTAPPKMATPNVGTRKCIFTYYLELGELYNDVDAEMVYTAINLYDRYSASSDPNNTPDVALLHQLAALVALSISAKVHGCRIFNQGELAKLSGDRFSPGDLTYMEINMLRVLNWSIHPSTPKTVLEYMKHLIFFGPNARRLSSRMENKMDYFLDIACSDHRSLHFPPSSVAWVCLTSGMGAATPDIEAGLDLLKKELHTESLAECELVIGSILATASSGEEAELSGCMAPERVDATPEKLPEPRLTMTSPDSVMRSISPPAVAMYHPKPTAAAMHLAGPPPPPASSTAFI